MKKVTNITVSDLQKYNKNNLCRYTLCLTVNNANIVIYIFTNKLIYIFRIETLPPLKKFI